MSLADERITVAAMGNIAVVAMEHKSTRNGFTPQFIAQLDEVFRDINSRQDLAVVVIHGYENYFSSGGTREELLALSRRERSLHDMSFFRVLLDCPVPTVAAMQGHAIGGGLALGLFADFIVLSEESLYGANFTSFGFTPGMATTCTVPRWFGPAVGHEMLYSAKSFPGLELKRRGVSCPVEKRADTLPRALQLAREIADKPVACLRVLKRGLTGELLDAVTAAMAREARMHDATFPTARTRELIERSFANTIRKDDRHGR
jgi:polyketide biosynthesis enoyl-CoA hydratase PksI